VVKKINKLISVVVPKYFEEEVSKGCYNRLKLVLDKQNYYYKFIFVNDGRTDRTLDILNEIAYKDKQVKIINIATPCYDNGICIS